MPLTFRFRITSRSMSILTFGDSVSIIQKNHRCGDCSVLGLGLIRTYTLPSFPKERFFMDQLKQEFDALRRYIQRVRQEIASIDRPADEDHKFDSTGDQLDAIVKATEEATDTIMECMENNEEAIGKLREQITDPVQVALLDQISNNGNEVFKACSFQDITGQRVNKVVKSITYVEERVLSLVDIMGKEMVDEIEVIEDKEKTEDEKLLSGPQLEGKGLSQNDIDNLFD